MDVKLVSVVVEGGGDTLQIVLSNIKRNVPTVIINNSGKISDILAYAFYNADFDQLEQEIDSKVRNLTNTGSHKSVNLII